MSSQAADRDLLLGLLAFRMGHLTRDALIASLNDWTPEAERTLGEILVERGDLLPHHREMVEPMVIAQLDSHGGDTAACLASLGSTIDVIDDLRRSLEKTAILDSLGSITSNSRPTPPETLVDDDPYATRLGDPYATRADSFQPFAPGSDLKIQATGVRYRKVRNHAKGGLGIVFVARDDELNREVALKEIQDHHADHPTSRARFLIEAEITGSLEHPGIVPVYGLGAYEDGRPFYAMRFIRGESLKDAIAAFHADETLKEDPGARTLALQKLLRRFLDVCNAMAYAHSRGVLHRDLKPENVMVGPFGETLVVDWGMAKATGPSVETSESSPSGADLNFASASGSNETLPGSVVGTPAYMSPEQAEGRLDLLSPASDVYSLGGTLYTLITGASPMQGKSLTEVLADVRDGRFPRPRAVARWIDPALEAICLKAMALRPEDRYATPRSMADDLESWLADEPVSALPEPWTRRTLRWSRRHRTAVTAVSSTLLVAAVLLGVFEWMSRNRVRRTDEAALATLAKAEQHEIEAQATGDLLQWEAALGEASRAEAQLESGGGSESVRRRVTAKLAAIKADELRVRDAQAAVERDRKLVEALEEAKTLRTNSVEGVFNPIFEHKAFLNAFRAYGIDIETLTIDEAAERVHSSTKAMPLLAALDEWSHDATTIVPREKLDGIARKADPDPIMNALRDAAAHRDPAELRRLVEAEKSRPEWVVRIPPFVRILAGFDPTASLPFLESIRRERPSDFWINHTLAEAYEFGKPQRLDEATRYYSVAVALRPTSAAIHVNLGSALRKKGDFDGAIAAQREAIRLKPDDAEAYIGLGNALDNKGDFDGAIAAQREAIRLQPRSGMAYNSLGNSLMSKNDREAAATAFREAIRLNDPLGHYGLGRALMEKKEFDQAITSFREAIRLLPDLWKARFLLGNALMEKQDWPGAAEAYRESIRLHPFHAEAYDVLGNALRNQGNLDAAGDAYSQAIRYQPNDPLAYNHLGDLLRSQGKFDAAGEAFRQAIRAQPNDAVAYNNLGNVLRDQGRLDSSVDAYRQAIRFQPDHAEALCSLGLGLIRQGSAGEAVGFLERGHDVGSKLSWWRYPSAEWLRNGRRLASLETKLPAIQKGEPGPTDPDDSLALASLCYDKKLFATSAKLLSEAFDARPALAENLMARHRSNAARVAALAGSGLGKDDPPPDESTRAKLRDQSREWLKRDLAAWARILNAGNPEARKAVVQVLTAWKANLELAGIRDEVTLSRWPEDERQKCRDLWAEVEALLKKASGN